MRADGTFKLSFYNIILDESAAEVQLWNTKRGSIVKLERPVYEEFERSDFEGAGKQYIETLLKEGVLVPAGLNERQEILFRARQRQYSTAYESFGFVVAPTLACNFHCPYCFEEGIARRGTMSEEVQRAFVRALEKKLRENAQVKSVRITWFGGEPLLAYDAVLLPLQGALTELCGRMGVRVSFSIITNGYYLTAEKFDPLFKEGGTKFVQITLDGSEGEYAKRKGTTAKAFHRVIENILDLSDYLCRESIQAKIHIRFNADNANYADIKELAARLKAADRAHENIDLALERLREYGPCLQLTDYCTTEEFEDLKYDFDGFIGKAFKFPEPKTVFCGQHCMNAFCIGPEGEIYKCEHDLGVPEHVIGNIETGLTYDQYFLDFMDQPLPEKCLNCQILPVCMGGCPHRRFAMGGRVECDFTIKNLVRAVKRSLQEKEVK